MPFEITPDVKALLTSLEGLEDVKSVDAQVGVDTDGEQALYLRVVLRDAVQVDPPTIDVGRRLQALASTLRRRAAGIPAYPYVSFVKEGDVAA